jgi:hypothetical protein
MQRLSRLFGKVKNLLHLTKIETEKTKHEDRKEESGRE